MTFIIVEFVIVLVGFAVTAVLFYRIPTLPDAEDNLSNYRTISVIIPARNEEHNLPLLLADLRAQTVSDLEIIIVDDDSDFCSAHTVMKKKDVFMTLFSRSAAGSICCRTEERF